MKMISANLMMAIICLFAISQATIINIPGDYPTIQQGIDASVDGDTVLVQPDTYSENIDFKGYNITVGSMYLMTGDTSFISSTVINGGQSCTVVSFGGNDSLSVIIGFTIKNGAGCMAGGIYCDDESSPKIDHNIITGNSGDMGGGIYCEFESNPTIINNIIRENFALTGGAILCYNTGYPIISGNTIINNSARYHGAAIACEWGANPIINGNTISGNSVILYDGGGIYCAHNSNPIISGNVVNYNSAQKGGGIYCHDNSDPVIDNNDINFNSAFEGGGIACYDNSNPYIGDNNIACNSFYLGGGIFCETNSNPHIFNNSIHRNYANWGSGIVCLWNSNASISNNLIVGNFAASEGAGIYCVESNPVIVNNTLTGNTADNRGGGMYCVNSSPLVLNSIFWADTSRWLDHEIFTIGGSAVFNFCDIENGWPGQGNINVNPLFRDAASGDFHLMAIACGDSADSPCIDAGDPNIFDSLLDCSWGLGGLRSDMGAYGGGDSATVGIIDNSYYLPDEFVLLQNYPNPFNSGTIIRFIIVKSTETRLAVYDLLGREVQTLIEGYKQAGIHTATFDATGLSSGVYFYRLRVGEAVKTKRMVLLK